MVLIVLGSLVGVVVLVAAAGAGFLWYENGRIHRVGVKHLSTVRTTGDQKDVENVLLIGSTSRCSLKQQNPAFGLCDQGVTGVNSDVVMILHLDPATHKASLLSIPRDTFIPNARADGLLYCSDAGGCADKIDAALADGPTQIVQVIRNDFGIAVNHYKPQWLRDIHVLKNTPVQAGTPGTTASTQSPPSSDTSSTQPAAPVVTTSRIGIGTATVKVSQSNYTVVIATFNSCWVEAQVPGSVNPVINRTLEPGQTVSIPVTGGQLNVELGALAAGISVQIDGKTVPGWILRPDAVPFVATFTNS